MVIYVSQLYRACVL